MLCQVLNPVLQNRICLRVVDFLIAGHIYKNHKNLLSCTVNIHVNAEAKDAKSALWQLN